MNYIITTTDGDYLQHHGIMGQRWGVRRYQNEDGTLTEEGRMRLRKTYDRQTQKIENERAANQRSMDNTLKTKQDVEREGIYNKTVRSRYQKLVDDMHDAEKKGDYETARLYRNKIDKYATDGFGKSYTTYTNAALNGIKNEYLSSLDERYKGYVLAAEKNLKQQNDLMNLDIETLLNSNKGFTQLKKDIKSV